jgi:hypothetical protein
MMWNRFKSLIAADIKIISHDKTLLARSLAPLILIILVKFVFPPLSGFIFSKTGLLLDKYYSLIAITFVLIIAMLPGIVNAFIYLNEKYFQILHVTEFTPAARTEFLFSRMIINAFFSFVLVMITIILAKPVPGEGWLRNLFAGFLLSIQSPFVFLFISSFNENKNAESVISWLYWVFLIAAPFGLMLHHPWNYFVFFSPMYWTACAWIVPSPLESLIYGSIAVILTSGGMIVFFRHFLRKHVD